MLGISCMVYNLIAKYFCKPILCLAWSV